MKFKLVLATRIVQGNTRTNRGNIGITAVESDAHFSDVEVADFGLGGFCFSIDLVKPTTARKKY